MDLAFGALSTLLPKLALLLTDEYKLEEGVREEIKLLIDDLQIMLAALRNISEIPEDQLEIVSKIWGDVRGLSYDIEDSIETFISCGKGSEQVRGFKEYIGRAIDLLTKARRAQEIANRRDRYQANQISAKPAPAAAYPHLLAQHKITKEFVGNVEAIDELIENLMEGNKMSKQQGKIISVLGIGGVGKTTIANAVCEKLRAQFDCCAFVSVSRTPDMKKLFKDMLYQLGINVNNERLDEHELVSELNDFLQDKRYFAVIDNIWDIPVWELIQCALPDNDRGYRIITTTRSVDIARLVGVPYRLTPLSANASRKLFFRRIFGSEDGTCPYKELAEVSDIILKKCAGLPLAINTVAGLLAAKRVDIAEWIRVYDSISTELEKGVRVMDMRMILSLGYYDLPAHLKPCFLYLSGFPENYDIDKNCLIWLWIAEGFINCIKGGSQFECGESYLYELVNRNLIQVVQKTGYDMTEYCRVHDTLLDFIRSLSSQESFVTVVNDVHPLSPSKKVRRLSVQNIMLDDAMHGATMSMRCVRTVFVFSSVDQIPTLLSLKFLRVLNLQSICLSQGYNLEDLGNLLHLRYLGLGDTHIARLPEKIGNLKFLKTLDITGNGISSLPSSVVLLTQLMCLRIGNWTRVPIGIGNLTCLEELSTLCISDSEYTVDELGYLKELRVLSIDCRIQWNGSLEKSLVGSLNKLQKVHTLSISVYGECNLDAWDAPQHLRKLELSGCWLSRLSSWMNPSRLPNLSFLSIELRNLHEEDLDVLGRLSVLSYLDLEINQEYFGMVERFVVGAGSFPCLVHCVLRGYVGHVVFRKGAMPRLTSLCFTFPVREIREIAYCNGYLDSGLGNLSSLENITVSFLSEGASEGDVEEVEAALKHATAVHPNHPNLEIY